MRNDRLHLRREALADLTTDELRDVAAGDSRTAGRICTAISLTVLSLTSLLTGGTSAD